ncbi:cytochrome P450 [Lentinula aciculospora]|uniref:Cytochrome P450 n=1 Tax=Lentinula aciculospora TaxID=153920 RepID=A0A9W9AD28_9AGAR|nr:cytochrome P450 [Lentinula aciculospora]
MSESHLDYSSLVQSIVVVILSASLWTLLRNRRRLHGVSSLSQLRGPRSQSWFKGNYFYLFNMKAGWEFHKMLAEEYGSAVQITGFLGRKQFYTFDPKAMHQILVKDGSLFQPHRIGSGGLLFGQGLLSTIGEHHRKQRKMLNPVFSIAHMRSMVPIFHDIADQLRSALSQRVQNGPREIDLLGWMARTALELIGQSGFGYSFDNMLEDVPRHKYSVVIKDLVPALTKLAFARFYLLPLALKFLPKNIRIFIMNITPWKTLHDVRDMVNYMHELSVEIFEEKKRALEEGDEAVVKQIGKGKDLLSIMMKENMKADDEDKLEEAEIIGQVTFIFAAMDTTSSGMSRILHLLALHPEVQDKMREEIVKARRERQGSQFSYDELVGLPYLDAVCRETLRLYAPVSSMLRKSTADAIVPLSRPTCGVDGNEVREIFLPKATTVMISILNANRDPELWGPDVLEWKPERWLSPLPESIVNSKMPGVYSHLMTFNGGSRSCIGFKFSQLEMKVIIAMLVENFRFSSAPKKEIFWQMSGIASPVVVAGDDSEHPQLPLMVELAERDL